MQLLTPYRSRLGTVSCLSLMACSCGAFAQDAQPVAGAQDGTYLGTIVLGESKRDIQTDTPVATTSLDQEELDDRQASTVGHLIDSVPGVSLVNGNTPQGSGINIRGFGATGSYGTDQKVKVVIDGATTGSEELYRIGNQMFTDPELFRRVEVIRGTMGSFEYGSGIVGGVVQLETKDASDFTGGEPGFKFRQTLGGQSNGDGWLSSSILAWQPTEDLEFIANYTYRDVGNYTDGAGNEIADSDFDLPSLLLKGKVTFGDAREHALTFSYTDTSSSQRDVPYDSFGLVGGSFGNVNRDIQTTTATLRYDFDSSDNDLVNLSAILAYSEQEIESSYISGSSPIEAFFPGISALGNADQDYETTKFTLKNTAFFDTGSASHELRAGIEWSNSERLDANSAPGGTDERIALFAIDEISFGNGLTITPAVRYESQKITGTSTIADGETLPYDDTAENEAWMGGLSAFYEFNNGFAVFGSASYTEVLPPIDDLNNLTLLNTSEKARTYEIGFSYAGQDVFGSGDQLKAKFNAYRTNLWDVTSYSYTDPTTMISSPIDSAYIEGVEIEASYATLGGFYADLNANIVSGTETWANGDEADWRQLPGDSIGLTLGKRFNDTFDVNWEVVAAKGAKRIGDGEDAPGWSVHNLRAAWTPQDGALEGFEVRAAVENLLDREYTTNLSTLPAMGRNFKLTVAKTF